MADFIAVPECASLTFVLADVSGKRWTMGLFFTKEFGWNVTNLTLLASTAGDAWEELAVGLVNANQSLVEIVARSEESETAPSVTWTPASPIPGTLAGNPVPLSAARIVTLRTDSRGRSYRGRVYVAGGTQNIMQSNITWTVASVGSAATIINDLVTAIVTELNAANVVVSRFTNGAARATGVATPVTSYVGRTRMGTIRKRVSTNIG